MFGQMSCCQICKFQDRREDDGQEARCFYPDPVADYDTCDLFLVVEGPLLGARLAELYSQVDLAWGMLEALLDKVEQRAGAEVALRGNREGDLGAD